MAQPPLPPSSSLNIPSTQFAGIDAAVASIVENDPNNAEIIGTAVALSTSTMDRIEGMLQKLRARGKQLPKTKAPLTVDRPFARAPSPAPRTGLALSPSLRTGLAQSPALRTGLGQSPPPKTGVSPLYPTAVSISPEPRTAFSASPVSSRRKLKLDEPKKTPAEQWANVNPGPGPKIRAAKSPLTSTARESEPDAKKSKREVTPPPKSNEIWSDLVKAAEKQNVPAGVTSPGIQKPDASQRSTRTARGVSPVQKSSGYPTAIEPASPPPRDKSQRSTCTGRGLSPAQRSSGYPTAISPGPTQSPIGRRQSISNVQIPSTRTGLEVTPRPSEANLATARSDPAVRTARGRSPAPRSSGYPTAISPAVSPRPTQPDASQRSTRTGRGVSPAQRSSGYPTAMSPGYPRTTQPDASQRSARTPRGVSPVQKSSGYPTAIEPVSPPPRDASQRSTRTGRGVSPCPPRSPIGRRQSISNIQIPSTRTGLEVTPRPSEANLATARSDPAVRTGRGRSPAQRSSGYPTAISPAVSPRPTQPDASQRSTRTGRGVSPIEVSSGYPTAVEPESPPPRSPIGRRQSISNVQIPSTRTGLEVTPRPSEANLVTARSDPAVRTGRGRSPAQRSSGYPTAISPAVSPRPPPRDASQRSTRTGRGVSPAQKSSGYLTAIEPDKSQRSTRTGRGLSPAQRSSGYPTAISPGPTQSPIGRRQSISNVQIPSTRTGLEVTPRPSEANLATARSDPAVRTGRGRSPAQGSSGYPTAISPGYPRTTQPDASQRSTRTGRGLSPAQRSSGYPTAISPGPLRSPIGRRQSISNLQIPSTRTGLEATPRPSEANLATARSDPAVRTGRGASYGTARGVSPVQVSSGYPTAISPGPGLERRQSISNLQIPSTRTGLEHTPPQNRSFRAPVAPDALDQSTRTGREGSPSNAPQLITRTTVVPVNQTGEGGEDGPGVMLFVHSFYVFSMTLNAWANHLSNQNQNPAQ